MSLERDYALLEVKPGASPEEVRRAYLDLVKVWHPDRFPNDPRLTAKADQRLMEINLAYERLRAPVASDDCKSASSAVTDDSQGEPPTPESKPSPVDSRAAQTPSDEYPMSTITKINVTLTVLVVAAGLFTIGLLFGQLLHA
jgi:hypothetical protein